TSGHSWNINIGPAFIWHWRKTLRTQTDPAPGVWPDRLDTGAGRPASPIRAARRLSNPTTHGYPSTCRSHHEHLFVVTESRAERRLDSLFPTLTPGSTGCSSEFTAASITARDRLGHEFHPDAIFEMDRRPESRRNQFIAPCPRSFFQWHESTGPVGTESAPSG